MTTEELKDHITEYFSDTSRSRDETRDGLEDAVAHAQVLLESLADD